MRIFQFISLQFALKHPSDLNLKMDHFSICKLSNNFFGKLKYNIMLGYFAKIFKKAWITTLVFCNFGGETECLGNFEKTTKFSKLYLWKWQKNYFTMFQSNLSKYALQFWGFGRKTQLIGNLLKVFENFQKVP